VEYAVYALEQTLLLMENWMQQLKSRIRNTQRIQVDADVYEPILYRLTSTEEQRAFEAWLSSHPDVAVLDTLHNQLKELMKIQHPAERLSDQQIEELIEKHLDHIPEVQYGVWVYYPWRHCLIHILDEDEFIQVRTNRNLYKITPEEQRILSTKKIGIIGLSVGQSVALTLAMERTFGELRIADFDRLEITNLNRLRTSLTSLGLRKTVIVAREIKEIDPYLKIVCYPDGVTLNNINQFLLDGGKLDLLVDECDSVDIKIQARVKAKAYGIPVVMETSDRGLIDVERFDIDKALPILHGLVDEEEVKQIAWDKITPEQRMQLVMRIVDGTHLSERMKMSIGQIGKTINTWPQLASSVVAGGAHLASIIRLILLGRIRDSFRLYFDIEDRIQERTMVY